MGDACEKVETGFESGPEVDHPHNRSTPDPNRSFSARGDQVGREGAVRDIQDIHDELYDEDDESESDAHGERDHDSELDADDELRLRRVMHRLRMRFDPEIDEEDQRPRARVCPIRRAVSGEIVL